MKFSRLAVVCAAFALAFLPARRATGAAIYDRSGDLADLRELPQSPLAYAGDDASRRLVGEDEQAKQALEFVKKFFSPWDDDWPRGYVESFFVWDLTKSRFWGGDLRPIEPERLRAMIAEGDYEKFPSRSQRAVAVANTSMRLLPSLEPLFVNPDRAGEGWPFDYAQNSAVWHGTPLRVLHESRDGAWLFCVCNYAAGWVPARDVALADDAFVRAYRTARLSAVTVDSAPLRDTSGRTVATGRMGAIFPLGADGISVPLRSERGEAVTVPARAPEGSSAIFPLELTRHALASLAEKLMGTPYGWGGLDGGRDCSATVRDLFAPFGLWLPRNSAPQARECGDFVNLEGKSDEEKLAAIRDRGVPFASLIGMKGHIGLYLGYDERGEPLLLHNTWGVALQNDDEPDLTGRVLIGRTVITTLRPGRERDDVSPRGLLPKTETLTMLPGLPLPAAGQNPQKPLAISRSLTKIGSDGGASATDHTAGRKNRMEERKNAVTMKGAPLTLVGPALKVGDKAPDFSVVDKGMAQKTLKDYEGEVKVISVTPSLDTPVCDLQATWFHEDVADMEGVRVLNISMDLPFALGRYCAAKGFDNVETLSDHRDASFGTSYGVLIKELRLLTRAVFVVDRDDVIRYVEVVPEATNSVNFDKLLEAVKAVAK